jgi:hypothetical protein
MKRRVERLNAAALSFFVFHQLDPQFPKTNRHRFSEATSTYPF